MPDPEQLARQEIDALLKPCGWDVQDKRTVNLAAARGVAVRELTFKSGEPDYTLFVDGKVIGTIEAKPAGHSLTGVEEQSHVLESLGKQEGMLAGADYITSSVIPRRVELRCTVGNLENSVEEGKMSKKLRRRIVVRTKDTVGYENAAFSLEDFESGKIAVNPDWLREIWSKWLGDESIEELLAALEKVDRR